jgi:PAS domain S-box-containing protein
LNKSDPQRLNVLHVDDEDDQLEFARSFLTLADSTLNVLSYNSPAKALRRISEGGIDCVVSDYMMPEMNGIELAEKVRKLSTTPFIIYTGRGSEEVAEAAFSAGVDDYIRKEANPSHYMVLAKSIRTISEKHRTEQELRVSEERFKTLVTMAPDGMVTVDLLGNITFINDAFSRLTGYPNDEIVGKHFTELKTVRFRDIPHHLGIFSAVMSGKHPPPYEFVYKRKDRTEGWGEAHIKLLNFGDRKEIILILRDISQRKEMADELKLYTESLEAKMKQRTEDLIDAERMAAAGKVAAMVGHDIRQPLQNIRNITHIMKKSPDKVTELADIIDVSVDKAIKLLDELGARTDEHKLQLAPSDLDALLKNVIRGASLPLNIALEYSTQGDLTSVNVDPFQMQRVFDNIVKNAVEAMPRGGKLKIRAIREGGSAVVTFSDTGIGISKEQAKNLFKPFQTSKPDGIGLGLSFCKRVVEGHGGSITFTSRVNVGTTFEVTLPSKIVDPVTQS